MFQVLATPLLVVECLVASGIVGIGVLRIVRIDRRAGIVLATGGLSYGVGVLTGPLLELGAMSALYLTLGQGPSSAGDNVSSFAGMALIASVWLAPLGRAFGLALVAYALFRLSMRVAQVHHERTKDAHP